MLRERGDGVLMFQYILQLGKRKKPKCFMLSVHVPFPVTKFSQGGLGNKD